MESFARSVEKPSAYIAIRNMIGRLTVKMNITIARLAERKYFLRISIAIAVRNWIGVMKNDVSIVHKFFSTNTYSR